MPRQPFPIDQGPEEAESEAHKGKAPGQKAPDRRGQIDGSAVPGHELDPPGPHTQGLAASHPETSVKKGRDDEQKALEPYRARRNCLTPAECQYGKSRQHPQSGIQEQIVQKGSRPAQEIRGIRLGAVRVHGSQD